MNSVKAMEKLQKEEAQNIAKEEERLKKASDRLGGVRVSLSLSSIVSCIVCSLWPCPLFSSNAPSLRITIEI